MRLFARVVGVSALVYAASVGIEPSLAPGLDPDVIMNDDMDMDDDMEAPCQPSRRPDGHGAIGRPVTADLSAADRTQSTDSAEVQSRTCQ